MRRKIINCINNCENILSAVFFSPRAREISLFPNNSGDFPRLSRCFHQSTNENMCFLLPKIFFFWRSERELRKGRVRKNSPDRKRREIFLEFICALFEASGFRQRSRVPRPANAAVRNVNLLFNCRTGTRHSDGPLAVKNDASELWNVSSIFHSRVNKKT